MYGLVNKAVEDLIRTRFDDDTWERIKAAAEVDAEGFISMDSYPDELTYRMIGAASQVLNLSAAEVLEVFGEFWVQFTGRAGYGALFKMAGRTLPEFLHNLDALHERISHSFPDLRPPSFACTERDDGTLLLRYESSRDGLAPMVRGLLRGLGARFSVTVDVDHVTRRADGAPHDEFVIRYADAA